MKKLLLFLMAFLLFAPPGAKAEKTMYSFVASVDGTKPESYTYQQTTDVYSGSYIARLGAENTVTVANNNMYTSCPTSKLLAIGTNKYVAALSHIYFDVFSINFDFTNSYWLNYKSSTSLSSARRSPYLSRLSNKGSLMTHYGTNMVFRLNTAQADYGYYIKSIRFYTYATEAYVAAYAKNLAASNENIKLEDYNWENNTDLYNVATWYAAPGQHDTEVTLVCPESFYAGKLADGSQYSATDVTNNTGSCNTLPILKFEKFEIEYEYKYEPTAPAIPSLYNNSKLLGLGETFFFAKESTPSLSFSKGSDSDQDNIVVFYKYVPEGTPAEDVQYTKGDLGSMPKTDTQSGTLYWYAADAVDESFKSDVATQVFKTYPSFNIFHVAKGNGPNDTPNDHGTLWVYTQDNPTGEKYEAGKTYNDILRMVFIPSDPEYAKDAIIIESDLSAGGTMTANTTWLYIRNPAKMRIRTQNGGNLYSVSFSKAESISPEVVLSNSFQYDDTYHTGKWSWNGDTRIFTYSNKEYVFNSFSGNTGTNILTVTYIPAEPKIPDAPYATLAPNGRGSDNGGIFKMIDGLDLQINSKTPVYYYPTTDNTVTSVPVWGKDDYHTLQPGQVLKVENSWFNGKSTGKILLQSTLWTPKDMDGGVAPVFIEVINTTKYAKLSEIIKPDNTGRDLVVTPSAPMTITGVYATRKDGGAQLSSYYAYVVDADGTAIKLVSTSPFPASYTAGAVIPAGGLVGEFRYSYGAPEIVVSNYTGFLKETTPGTAPEPAEVTTISTSNDDGAIPDFNRKVVLRHAKWLRNTKSSQVEDTEGNRYLIYSRLITPGVEASEFTEDMFKSEAGTLWAIEGYVGQVEGATAIFPTAKVLPCPATPILLAPNPISGDVNAISPEVNVNVNRAEDYTYYYKTAEDGELNALPEEGLTLKAEEYTTAPCNLWVYASANGLYSMEPAHATITWHTVKSTVASIADFKKDYLNHEVELPGSLTADKPGFSEDEKEKVIYHQFSPTAKAIIVEATPEWLYIRDLEPTDGATEFTSANYLMIHNLNQWHNPQVGEGEDARDLAPGDIITNFALIPAHTSRGNLVSESTGFARTVQYVETKADFVPVFEPINVGYVEPTNPGFHKNITLGENERMRLVQLKNVKIENPEDDVYTLVIGPDDAEPITLAFDIFTQSVNGFRTAYNPDNADELYDIKGVLIRDNRIKDSETYALALISFDTQNGAVAAPEVFVQGTTDAEAKAAEVQEFEHGLVVEIAPEEGSFVYYSLNGKDPLNNTDAESRISYTDPIPVTLPEGQDRVVVKAFAYRPGYKPSATVTRTFVKTSRELSYLLNFINQGEQGRAYHFNGNVRIAAVAGNWMMVRGSVGHYLPIYNADGWNTNDYAAEKYLTDFLMTFDNTEGNIRGMAKDFKPSTDKPADIKEIELTPDSVTFISEANARRYVKLHSALVHSGASAADASATEWTVTGTAHESSAHRLAVEMLDFAADKLRDGGMYDIEGFVMLDKNGKAELWPLTATEIKQTERVEVKLNDVTLTPVSDASDASREYVAEFEKGALVTLFTSDTRESTKIYYSYDNEKWYTYGQPFLVLESANQIHAYAQAVGERASAHTHIKLTRKDVAAKVEFAIDNSIAGRATVTLSCATEGAKIYWWTSSNTKPAEYAKALVFNESEVIYAYAAADGKADSEVSHAFVKVAGSTGTPDIPADKISGKVVFSIDDTSDPKKVTVYLAPEEGLTGTIYYLINPTGQVTPDNGLVYTNPIEMKEGGRIVAILVENGKYAGEPTDIAVWLIPTDIDGIDSERKEDEIRAEGSDIIAPEGSEVFDITGRRVNATGLRAGIYIVRTPGGKAVKVKVD
jgi:hypothetical protein